MRKRYISISLLAVPIVAGIILLITLEDDGLSPRPETLPSPHPAIERSEDSIHAKSQTEQSAIPRVENYARSSLKSQFSSSSDLWAFVEEVLPRAERGDPESQYFVFKALGECYEFAWTRSRSGKDAWLTAHSNLSVELRQEVARSYDRCEPFTGLSETALISYYGDDHYSVMRKWLRLAAEGGYSVAQAWQAAEDITLPGTDAATRARSLEMLSAAALTKEPEALTVISMLFAGADTTEQVAWLLVACGNGQACGPGSTVIEQLCALPRSCTRDESTEEIILANLGEWGYAQARKRADEISAALGKRDSASLQLDKLLGIFSEQS